MAEINEAPGVMSGAADVHCHYSDAKFDGIRGETVRQLGELGNSQTGLYGSTGLKAGVADEHVPGAFYRVVAGLRSIDGNYGVYGEFEQDTHKTIWKGLIYSVGV